jgi:hypothetical protein
MFPLLSTATPFGLLNCVVLVVPRPVPSKNPGVDPAIVVVAPVSGSILRMRLLLVSAT